MNLKNKLGLAATLAAIIAVAWLSLGSSVASASAAQPASTKFSHTATNPNTGPYFGCAFRTLNGYYYLTAVGGGGRTTDVIHTNAQTLSSWEKFNLYYRGYANVYAIQTLSTNYLTAVGGGGRTTDAIHSDATSIGSWEEFYITCGH